MHAPALTLKDFCDAYRVCRETAYQQIRARRLRAVKLGRKNSHPARRCRGLGGIPARA